MDAYARVRHGAWREPPPDRKGTSYRIMASLLRMTLEGGIDPGAAGGPPFFCSVLQPAFAPRLPRPLPKTRAGHAACAARVVDPGRVLPRRGGRIRWGGPLRRRRAAALPGSSAAGVARCDGRGAPRRALEGDQRSKKKDAHAVFSVQGTAAYRAFLPNPRRRAGRPFSR